LPVDICPVTCEIDVDINSISFGTIPVSFAQPITVTQTANPLPVSFTQPITVTQSANPLPVDICPVNCDVPIVNGSVSPLQVQLAFALGTPAGGTRISLTNTAITGNTNIFTAFSPSGTVANDAVTIRVQWSAIDGGVLSYSLNDTDFVGFNDQNALKENSSHVFDVIMDHADTFVLQFEKDTTITFLRVVQII